MIVPKAGIVGERQASREERVREAFYRGADLTLENPVYLRAFCGIVDELLRQDAEAGDLSVEAMGIGNKQCGVEIRSKQAGFAAGVSEAAWLYKRAGASVEFSIEDGAPLRAREAVLRAGGAAGVLLTLERTAVNLLQRMSGIATATHNLAELARNASAMAHVVATRKAPWGLLDKRAVHCGGGGTHRLNLSDAVLIKTNHLRLTVDATNGDMAMALQRAWQNRKSASFFEVEVSTREEAVRAAGMLAAMQTLDVTCPCIVMLDNFSPPDAARNVAALRQAGLHDSVLVEASGNISEGSIAEYAASGVDAISVGALTHSTRVLDLSATLISEPR